MNPIAETLAKVELGQPAQFRNLAVYPLTAPSEHAPAYVLLDEARARKLARVTEISDSGSVPELMFDNDGEADIPLMDGEHRGIRGGASALPGGALHAQERVVHLSALRVERRPSTFPPARR